MKKTVLLLLTFVLTLGAFAQDAAEKISQGNEALQAKDYAKAFKLYDDAMNNLGEVEVDNSINYNIGYAAYKSNNHEGAIKYFDKAIENNTNVSKAHNFKAMVYTDMKKYKEALDSYNKAIETSEENDPSMTFNAAIAAYKGKMYDKAVKLFDSSAKQDYKTETSLYYKAIMYKKLDNDEEYVKALQEGYEKFPGNKKISSALAKNYVLEGNKYYKKGAAVVKEANKQVKSGAYTTADDAYNAELDKAKEQFAKAKEVLSKALEIDPDNANAQKLMEASSAL